MSTQKIYPEIERLKSLLNSYAQMADVNLEKDNVSESEGDKIFQHIIDDYVKGIVSVDDLSSLCELSYAKINSDSSLRGLLLSGAEIEWDIRHKPLSALSSIEDLVRRYKKEALE